MKVISLFNHKGGVSKTTTAFNLKLSDVTGSKRPLELVMSEISRNAQARGLTPEILDSILSEE